LHSSKFTIFILLIVIAAANLLYFTWMWLSGNTVLSHSPNVWGAYGSYIGGVLAPFSAFVASYLIYKNLQLDSYLKSLEIIRSSISRFDEQLYLQFKTAIKNPKWPEYNGKEIIDAINISASQKTNANEDFRTLCAGLVQDLAILSNSISKYMDLLSKIDPNSTSAHWMVETEQLYWISKYSLISRKLIKIATIERVKEKLSPQQLKSLSRVMHADRLD